MQSPRQSRRGFTLVEMLVVIAIIGILAAILFPAVNAAITRARNASIASEIKQLEMAVEKYKNDVQDYPPNFFEDYVNIAWTNTVAFRHLKRFSRNAGENMALWTNNQNGDPLLGVSPNLNASPYTQLDAAETLVFWLGGLSKSASSPTTGNNGPLVIDTSTGAVVARPIRERENFYFEFKETNLDDIDGDGFPEYYPPYGGRVPYVYFDGRSYDHLGVSDGNSNSIPDDDEVAQYPPPNSPLIDLMGVVKPYVVSARPEPSIASDAWVPVYANDKKFQIVSAGLDGRYGVPGAAFSGPTRKVYQTEYSLGQQTQLFNLDPTSGSTHPITIVLYAKEDLDNITNFSGDTLESQQP